MEQKKYIFALGFFDGVHLGHQALLSACRELAEKTGAAAGVLTFDVHPQSITRGESPGLINTLADRIRLLRWQSMEEIVVLPFHRELRCKGWQEFVLEILQTKPVAGFVCGSDFRFGYQGEGTAQKLAEFCRQRGILCQTVPQQQYQGQRISSTQIRELLQAGELEKANTLLGHPHILTAQVVPGQGLGRTIGAPTANLKIDSALLLPKRGVYACKARLENGETYLTVTNIGNRPTVKGTELTVEPWLLDFQGDLYGQELTLQFYAYLREEKAFLNLKVLRTEIQKNGVQTRKFFEKK